MRSGRGTAAAALGFVLLLQGRARAQDVRLQGLFSASGGVTHTVTSTETDDGPDTDAQGFITASPGVALTYTTPRTQNALAYTLTGDLRFSDSTSLSATHAASWTARFTTSPTTSLSLGATGSSGTVRTLRVTQLPGAATLDRSASEDSDFLQGGVTEGFAVQLSPIVAMGQTASFLAFKPLQDDQTSTYTATGQLNAQRQFRWDTATLALTVAFTRFEDPFVPGQPASGDTPAVPDEPAAQRDQLINTLVGSWQHNYGRYVTSQLDLGVMQVVETNGDHRQLWDVAGLAAVRYSRDAAEAEIAYSHGATNNVFIGQILRSDQITLRLSTPLRASTHLGVEGTAGYQLGYPIVDGELGDPTSVLLADAALTWSPPVAAIPSLQIALRYQHSTQLAAQPDYLITNAVLLSLAGSFPGSTVHSSRIVTAQPFGSSTAEQQRQRQLVTAEPTEPEQAPPQSATQ